MVGLRIIKEYPNYELFHNNCQNFVKYLLESLCPEADIPDTIQVVLQRLRDTFIAAADEQRTLPGGYPCSLKSTGTLSFQGSLLTDTGETWYTASGPMWITAIGVKSGASTNISSTFYTARSWSHRPWHSTSFLPSLVADNQ